MANQSRAHPSVLVTGANGYIGQAVAVAFQRAGYTTYGPIRSNASAPGLQQKSIIPIIGAASDADAVVADLQSYTPVLDVVVSATADTSKYASHFQETLKLLRSLAKISQRNGVRPLVLFTSGCKDYGPGELHGSPHLIAHTEDSPIRPPSFLADRAMHATDVLKESSFDAAVLRPTNVHGYSSSYYGLFFEMAMLAKAQGKPITFKSDPRTILHNLNIDDCAEAYVALAKHTNRRQMAGQCFNISTGSRYETLRDVAEALARAYSLEREPIFMIPPTQEASYINPLTGFSQLVLRANLYGCKA